MDAITILDEDYPKLLLDLQQPPLVLFYKGNRSLLKNPKISIVGSRIISDYGMRVTKELTNCLKYKYTIVSGLAKGVDQYSHYYALNQGNTIGVLGCGIDYIYPQSNQYLFDIMSKNQLIISEFPGMVKPLKHHFPWRNRIIAGLSDKLIVTQAKLASGTMLTVNEALKINRDIYTIPYQIDDPNGTGCNALIQEGANIILTYDINVFSI